MNDSSSERKKIDVDELLMDLFKGAPAHFGTTHPDELSTDDPEIKALFDPYYSWIRGQQNKAEKIGTPEAHLEMSLKVTPFLVEAGFTHPDYVNEVVYDHLAQDLAQAEDLNLTDLVAKIRAKQQELLELLDTN